MDATEILRALQGDGFELTADGGDILLEPDERLTEGTAELIRQHKSELLELLRDGTPPRSPGGAGRLCRLEDLAIADRWLTSGAPGMRI